LLLLAFVTESARSLNAATSFGRIAAVSTTDVWVVGGATGVGPITEHIWDPGTISSVVPLTLIGSHRI